MDEWMTHRYVCKKDAISAAMEGYHSSVFLYGQTGTGKTYTMQVRLLQLGFRLQWKKDTWLKFVCVCCNREARTTRASCS